MKIFTKSILQNLAILALFIFSGMSNTPSLASGFAYRWGHPSPQGNTVYNIAFEDESNGWAVTGCGSILETDDGGESWHLISEPDSVCSDLYDILISSQGTLIASGENGVIMRSIEHWDSWQTFFFPEAGRLYDLALIPGGGISAAGENGVVLVSYDDGITWTDKGPGGSGYARHHLWKSATECYVVGYDMFYRTLDGGDSWEQVETPPAFGLNEIYFVNDELGYAVEDFGFSRTTDGGSSWSHEDVFSGILYRFRTEVIDELHWFAVTFAEGGELWETLDGGENWEMKSNFNNTGFLCLVRNGNRMLFGSDIGDIYYTDDGGATTQNAVENLAVFPNAPITIIGKRPDGVLFANNQPNSGIDNGTFFRSDDDGGSWYIPPQTPGLRWLFDIQFSDDQHGVVGSYSDIRYTNDGGDTWNESSLPGDYRLVNFALPAQDLYFAGAYSTSGGGNVYKSTDQGENWEVVSGGLPVNSLYVSRIAFADANTGYVACLINNLPDIYKTSDGGESWALIHQSGISDYISDMLWLDANTGLAVVPNNESGIFRTTDGGLNWIKVSETSGRYLTGSASSYIAAVNPGDDIFQESTDGGLNWLPYSPPFSSNIAGFHGNVHAIQGTDFGYILGGTGCRLMVADRGLVTGIDGSHGTLYGAENLQNIKVIPNPVKDNAVIRINLETGSYINLTLYDARGRLVHTFMQQYLQAGMHEVAINAVELKQTLQTGIYFVCLKTDGSFNSVKIILQ